MTAVRAEGAQTAPFSALTVLWIILAGVFSFSAFVVLSAYAPDLRRGDDGGAHALSRSAVGFAGIVELLRDDDLPVEISRREPENRDNAWSLLIVTPDQVVADNGLQHITVMGPTLVVLPKWQIAPHPSVPGWVSKVGPMAAGDIEKELGQALLPIKLARRTATSQIHLFPNGQPAQAQGVGAIENFQTIASAPKLEPLLVDDLGHTVLSATPDRHVMILSDPDLLNTQGLKDPRRALIALRLIQGLRVGRGPIAFDVGLNGFNTPPSLLKLAFQPPYLGMTLCLVAVAGLVGVVAANRFSPPMRAVRDLAFGKRALADNSAGLIRMARKEPRMAPRYVELSRMAVIRALGVRRMGAAELDPYLERVASAAGVKRRLPELSAQAAQVTTRQGLLAVARDLYQWRLEMTRERR
jgi:hypothetical protein